MDDIARKELPEISLPLLVTRLSLVEMECRAMYSRVVYALDELRQSLDDLRAYRIELEKRMK